MARLVFLVLARFLKVGVMFDLQGVVGFSQGTEVEQSSGLDNTVVMLHVNGGRILTF